MKRYWKYIRPYIQYYILGPCFMMMEVVGDVLLPYMLAKIINQGIAEKNVAYIIKIGAIMGLISVIMAVGDVLITIKEGKVDMAGKARGLPGA